jgi:glutathione S-transferase
MKLHTFAGSANSRKVEAIISHLGLDIETEFHDFLGGGLRLPRYGDINPNAKVPVLVDGDLTLWESNAIMQYLADINGSALFPRDARLRADIARWQFWELAHFNRALGTLAFEAYARPSLKMGEPDQVAIGIAQRDLARFAPVLERSIAGRRFLVGDALTLADYSVATFESYRSKVPFDWTPFPHINAYFDRMHEDPHWQRALSGTVLAKAA